MTLLTTGTKSVNSTHFQYTAKCTGCTSSRPGFVKLTPTGSNQFAWAAASSRPNNPSDSSSDFTVHVSTLAWNADFSQAENANFATLVTKDAAGGK
jgi:hypothetical protein